MKKQLVLLALCLCALLSLALCAAAADCNHNYVEQPGRTPASCTEKGSVTERCTRCGAERTTEIPMLDHDWVEDSRTAPTCTESGAINYVCSMCGTTKQETLAPTGHEWKESAKVAATCTEAGSITYRCTRCGEEKTEEIRALGHDFSVFKSTSATCTAKGESTYQCSRCKELTLKSVGALGHDYETTGGPTCTESGKYTYTCKRCKYTYDSRTQAALGHQIPDRDSAEWKVYKRATCEEEGSKRAKCKRCKEYVYIDLPKTDHNYGDLVLTKVPTSTAAGKAECVCENCGTAKTTTIARGTKDLTDYSVPPVTASVGDGLVASGTKVEFTCPLAEATIYYALGGKSPTSNAARIEYDPDEPLEIRETTIVKVYADYGLAQPSEVLGLLYLVNNGSTYVYLNEDASNGGYMELETGKKFRPDDKATRYEVIEALDALFNSFADDSDKVFSDVDSTHKKAVAKFTGAKLLDGYEDGTFRGKNHIKRAELAKVLALALGLDTETVKVSAAKAFKDVPKGHWAYKYIYALTNAGYLKGDDEGNFRPEDNISRAELATVMNRIAGIKENDGVQIADVNQNHWAYGYICAAVYKSR